MIDDLRLPKTVKPDSNRKSEIGNRKSLWRSLDEFSNPQKFREQLHDEFQNGASDFSDFNRRDFLKLMGASIALASLPACTRQPIEKIVPYVKQPEELVPGKPLFFATAMTLGGFATGLLAESHEGHPTKIEGNSDHPASLGATNIFHQAALLDLYDPDRSQAVLKNGEINSWENFVAAIRDVLQSQQTKNGGGLRILTETVSSPTLNFQIQELLKKFPDTKWHQFEPVNSDNIFEGAKIAFGEMVETQFHFDKAKIILSLDSDFLYSHPNSIRYARDFAERRRARFPQNEMSQFYAVESSPTVTGSNADHRLPVRAAEIENFARTLAEKLGAISNSAIRNPQSAIENWLSAIAEDLLQNRGESIVIVGENQPSQVHALAHLLNEFLGNVGKTIFFTESAVVNPINQTESLRELVEALKRNEVEALIILGGNPVFTAPADFQFVENLARAKFKAHLSSDVNETSALCDWHIPQNHFLESWSDARSFDGTISIVQPLILPLYAGKSAHEILDAMVSPPGRSDYDIVHDFWNSKNPGANFEDGWRKALHDGLIANTKLPEKKTTLRAFQSSGTGVSPVSSSKENPLEKLDGWDAHPTTQNLEITFHPDATIFDGRFANNGWLQELPKPITKLVWDNAALISPAFAQRENLSNGDVVELEIEKRKLKIPVWIAPGQAENSIALSFGGGRNHVGTVGKNSGFNVFELRTSQEPFFTESGTLKKTGEKYPLVTTQAQQTIDSEERQILREGTFEEFKGDPNFVQKNSESPDKNDTLFHPQEFKYDGYRWGMAIDLSACIGCNACTIACQAENNIPVVGKTEVARGRVMHWIRVDSYFRGAPANPEMTHQPVPCMQCENAPCEVVCPVGATLHDKEGLNLQVYNRCVGTRYCSNNCPYKVRRFNFFEYADYKTPSLKPMRNPDVTVRWRGVMEKCTYCLQRISEARINSEEQNRKIRDGEIKTACQQVCPANAIVFGDIGDPNSRVSKLKSHKLNFSMLGELNTRPRTTYLAKLRNLNPKLSA
jgi:molybdopterin-containing oxidoreductase family iron-sulfur binding subunit